MIGNQQEKISLEITSSHILNRILELLLAFGAGMLAYALHGIMKNPIGVPGHHGLIFMGIIMTARLTTGNSASGTAASIGVGSIILFGPLGFADPFRMVTYMLPGIILDLLYLMPKSNRTFTKQLLVAALFGGLAFMSIPLIRTVMMGLTGIPYIAAMKYGIFIPIISFFFFGFAGGTAGKLVNRLLKFIFKH